MKIRPQCLSSLFAALIVASGCAQAQPAQSVQCSFNFAKAASCQMTDKVGDDGSHTMEFSSGNQKTRFVGKSQTGWWSGQLDGQPAMGFERNRGHVVFSTSDLKTSFEWWSSGSEHGTY